MPIFIRYLIIALLLGSTIAYVNIDFFLFELFTHWRIYYVLIAFVFLIAAAYYKLTYSILLSLLALMINLSETAPIFANPFSSVQSASRPSIKILVANAYYENKQTKALLDLIDHENPDLIGIIEVSPRWKKALQALHQTYPYYHYAERLDYFGMAVFSKLPLTNIEENFLSATHVPSLYGKIIWENYQTDVLLVHPPGPLSGTGFEERNQELQGIKNKLKNDHGKIIMGDFNMTRFSPVYKRFVYDLNIQNAADGQGWMPTWPSIPLIMIDHIFVDKHWQVIRTRRGPSIGSDHRPVITEIHLRT